MNTVYDISAVLKKDMVKYPSLREFGHSFDKDYLLGDQMSLSAMEMQMHIGTHIDAPYHYIKSGKKITELPLDTFLGEAVVIEAVSAIVEKSDVLKIPSGCKRVLFKTRYSEIYHVADTKAQPGYLSEEAAELLASLSLLLVGIDSFSIDKPKSPEKTAHKRILGAGIAALEGIDLYFVPSGKYTINCAPLKIHNAEAAPCRAILFCDK